MTMTTNVAGVRGASSPLDSSDLSSPAGPRSPERQTDERRRKRLRTNIVLQVLAMVGLGALLWPTGANWVSTLFHDGEISGYTSSVGAMPESERLAALDIAYDYNQHLPAGMLRDPYTSPDDPEDAAAYEAYAQILKVQGTQAIGSLTYPAVGIGLPIFHGTSDKVLREGVGHLFGSSLPVGGPGTHTALTSHSGQLNAKLFDNLHKAKEGQTFHITVLGETTYYEVDQVIAVLPEEVEHLQIVPGEDYVTLITCTPIGVNSHRLLVRGTRVPAPDTSGSGVIEGDGKGAGFPWWLIAFIGGSAAVGYLLFAPPKKKDEEDSDAAVEAFIASLGGDQ